MPTMIRSSRMMTHRPKRPVGRRLPAELGTSIRVMSENRLGPGWAKTARAVGCMILRRGRDAQEQIWSANRSYVRRAIHGHFLATHSRFERPKHNRTECISHV